MSVCTLRIAYRRRPGISLLEVLISAFVITIGLLGVAALMPVGHLQTARGVRADQAGAMSRMAFRDFKVRGMAQTSNWVDANGSAYNPSTPRAVAIDPYFLANFNSSQFPAGGTSGFTMDRISLRDGRKSGGKMGQEMADLIFVGSDDLAVEKPPSITSPPEQRTTMYDGVPARRLSAGRYSWLATLVPRAQSNLWMLSVVVFHQRALSGERVFDVKFDTTYPGPTEIAILLPAGTTPPTDQETIAALDIDADWILISQQGGGAAWYRIVSASKPARDGNNSNQWLRFLTLEGPDLNTSLPTQAALFPGAVAVHQRTVHLEGPSAWTVQD